MSDMVDLLLTKNVEESEIKGDRQTFRISCYFAVHLIS